MRFAKAQEKKMGMPEQPVLPRKVGPQKSPIGRVWIGMFFISFFCFPFSFLSPLFPWHVFGKQTRQR